MSVCDFLRVFFPEGRSGFVYFADSNLVIILPLILVDTPPRIPPTDRVVYYYQV